VSAAQRPPVAVVLPFHGTAEDADAALAELGRLRVREGDQIVLADNTPADIARGRPHADHIEVVSCEVKESAYAARNIGAESTSAPWILFVDADCRLPEGLLDAYFEPAPGPRCGAVAGQVLGVPDQPGLIPSYIRSRRHLDQQWQVNHPYRPMAVTANLLVRREAWAAVGGFAELTRAGGADADFTWRVQDAGWMLELNTNALVRHEHRDSLRALLHQARRDGSTAPWLARRHPGYPAMAPWRALPRALAGAVAWPLAGQPRRGLFKAIDGAWSAAFNLGAIVDDAAQNRPDLPELVLLFEEFPAAGDPRVAASASAGGLHVEALRRPAVGAWREGRSVSMRHWEDDNAATRAAAVLRRRGPAGEAAAAGRLAGAPQGARLLVEPDLTQVARRVVRLAGRPDVCVEALPADRERAAHVIRALA
jgi:GT2 family glycosyltransferase